MSGRINEFRTSSNLDIDFFQAGGPQGDPSGGGPIDGVEPGPANTNNPDDGIVLYSKGSAAPASTPAPAQGQAPPSGQQGQQGQQGQGQGGKKEEGGDKSLADKIKDIASRIGPNGIDVGGGVSIGGSVSPPMVKVTITF